MRRVLLARSCAKGGWDVVGEVKGVEEVGVGFACRGARSRRNRMGEIEVDPKCRGLRYDMSDLMIGTFITSEGEGLKNL